MQRVTFHSSTGAVQRVAAFSLLATLACAGAGQADETPEFTFAPPPGNVGSPPGVASGAPSSPPPAGPGGAALSPSSEAPSGAMPSAGVGSASAPSGSAAADGAAQSANSGTGSMAAPAAPAAGGAEAGAGAGSSAPPPMTGTSGAVPAGAPGRVGVELCPPGPFGNPLANGAAVEFIGAVGANNFFIFEGPVWAGDALYFSEIDSGNGNASQIDRYTPGGMLERGVFPDTGSNGLALDAEGNLLLAAHDVGGISRLSLASGALTRGAQTRNGQRFNSPNDLVVRGDGNIYFTDPDFQSPGGRIQGGTFVYRIAPPLGAGEVTVVDDDMNNPNGITLSPDGNTLYVSADGVLREYALDAAGAATPAGDLANISGPDGMTVDCAGNVYAVQNGAQTITIFSPDGESLGVIGPEGFRGRGVTNVAFGGPNRTTLFVTTFSQGQDGGLFSVELSVPGFPY